jgi:hypothetical protein
MIDRGQVVICMMNALDDYLGPIFEEIFVPLICTGICRSCTAAVRPVSS